MTREFQSVLRLVKRRVVAESNDPDRFVDLVFKNEDDEIDPELSVYIVPSNGYQITQVMAEHTAFSDLDPTARGAIDISQLYNVPCTKQDDGGCFGFRRETHHILLFGTDPGDALRIAKSVVDNPVDRYWIAETNQVREYGKRRYSASDTEWTTAANQSTKIYTWVSKVPNPNVEVQAVIFNPN